MSNRDAGIREHYGKWQVRYYVDGKRHHKNFERKSDAIDFRDEQRLKRKRGESIDPRLERVKLSDFATDWLEGKGNVGPRTLINIEGRPKNFILPTFGARRVSAIKPVDVRKWVAEMSKTRRAFDCQGDLSVLPDHADRRD